ncbi:MAG TPA: phage holin family protein [Acidimicrobiales bacterium]|nr:phage holin family protein [Acidimicrobiales bacterium]
MRLLLSILLQLIANAVGIIVAAAILENMSVDAGGFFIAVGVFTLISIVVSPMIRQAAIKRSPAILGSSALIVSLLALIGTALLTDGMQISGLSSWVLAAIIVWFAGLVATFLLPFVIFKRLRENKSTQ